MGGSWRGCVSELSGALVFIVNKHDSGKTVFLIHLMLIPHFLCAEGLGNNCWSVGVGEERISLWPVQSLKKHI